MQVNSVSSYANPKSGAQGFAASKPEDELSKLLKADSEDPAALIKKLARGGIQGYMAWQIQQLAARIARDVMSSMGVTEACLASMSAEERNEIAQKIMDEVKRRMEEMIKQQMQDQTAAESTALATGPNSSAARLMDFYI